MVLVDDGLAAAALAILVDESGSAMRGELRLHMGSVCG